MRLRILSLCLVAGFLLGIILTAFPVSIEYGDGVARVVIGNRVSAQEADYTCDGIDDDVQFQEAIDALPADGGMLYVLAGTYSFGDTVTRAIDGVSIVGLGGATVFDYDNTTALFTAGGDKWLFSNLWTDGGGLDMGATNDWCWLNVGVYDVLYSVLTSAGGVGSMEVHGNEWHTVAFATVASLTAVNSTLNDALDSIDALESDVSTLNATCNGLADDIALLDANLSALNSTVVGVQSDLSGLNATVVSLNSTVVGLQSGLSSLNATVISLNSTVVGLQADVSALNSTVAGHTTSIGAINTTTENNKVVGIVYVIDGGGSVISTGLKGFLVIPFACTVKNWTVVADVSGAIQVDVWQDTYANFAPTDADSMCSDKEVKIVATAQKGQDTDITDWTTTAILSGSVLGFNVDSVSTVTRVTIMISATRG